MKTREVLIPLVYLLTAAYFMNIPFQYFEIPEIITNFNDWIIFLGGLLLLFGAVNYLRLWKMPKKLQ